MITGLGRMEMLAFIAGRTPAFGGSIVVGVSSAAASANDTNLFSEVLRLPVTLRSPDYINGQVICRATVPSDVAGKFYEVGLAKGIDNRASVIVDGSEVWVNATADATNARFGQNALRVNAAVSGNTTATTTKSMSISPRNSLMLNYFVGSNVSSAYIRLLTNSTNYLHYALPVTAGYNSVLVPITSFAPTGAPDPLNLTSMVVYLASTAGGASQLHLDSVMMVVPENGGDLLDRQVLGTPFVKAAGIEAEIEIPIEVTI